MNTYQVDEIIPFSEDIQMSFYKILRALGNINCNYLSYTVEDRDLKKRTSFFSHLEWNKLFKDNNFRDSCQLSELCQDQGTATIIWNALSHNTRSNKMVMDARYDHDIANGITLSYQYENLYEMIAFGSRTNNPKFVSHDFQRNIELINQSLLDLRALSRLVF